MSQYSSGGVHKQNQGADFRGTPGLHIPTSGGVATKAVAFSELSDAQAAIDATIAALEASLNAVDTNIQSEIDGLALGLSEAAVNSLIQTALVGGVRYRGVAVADAVDVNTATGFTSYQTGDMFRVSSGGTSAFGFALSIGDFVIRNASNGWDKIDSTDPGLSAADSSITVTQTGANSYTVKIATAITDRIIAAESAIATLETGLAAAVAVNNNQNTTLSVLETDVSTISTSLDQAVLDIAATAAVSATQASAIAAAVAVNVTQTSAIAAAVAENLANATAITAVQFANIEQDTAISALETDLAAAVAVNATQDSAITALQGETADLATVNGAQDTAIADLQTSDTDQISRLDQLDIEIAVKTSVEAVKNAIGEFYRYTHQIITLRAQEANGSTVYNSRFTSTTNGVVQTDFYARVPDSLAWAVVEIHEFDAPYEHIAPPKHEKLSAAPVGVNGAMISDYFLHFTFWGTVAVEPETVQVYINRYFEIGDGYGSNSQNPTNYVEVEAGS